MGSTLDINSESRASDHITAAVFDVDDNGIVTPLAKVRYDRSGLNVISPPTLAFQTSLANRDEIRDVEKKLSSSIED